MNATITLYDLQEQNGVIGMLENNPMHYTYYVFPGPSVKKGIILEAFSRPTIPWSVECEKSGKTRQEMLQFAERGLTAVVPSHIRIFWWCIFASLIFFMPCGCGGGAEACLGFAIALSIGTVISAIISIRAFITYVQYY